MPKRRLFSHRRRNKKLKNDLLLAMTYLSIDPSGSSTTALFEFENWTNYRFSHFTNQDWREQVLFLKKKVRELQARRLERGTEEEKLLVCYENSNFLRGGNKYFLDLIKATAGLALYLYEKKIPARTITSQATKKARMQAKNHEIPGLEYKRANGWYFRGQKLANEHELDALLVFWVYWTKHKGEDWPWSE